MQEERTSDVRDYEVVVSVRAAHGHDARAAVLRFEAADADEALRQLAQEIESVGTREVWGGGDEG